MKKIKEILSDKDFKKILLAIILIEIIILIPLYIWINSRYFIQFNNTNYLSCNKITGVCKYDKAK